MTTQNPHDKFFRDSFSRLELVREFLTEYLPAEILHELDLDTLSMESESYVDEELRDHHADILYTIHLKTGRPLFLYVLFEHKSYPDEWVAFQLLKYMVRIWERMMRDGGKLRPILPIVIYHGEVVWPVADDFQAMLGAFPDVMRPYLPQYRYLLYDYSESADLDLLGDPMLLSCLTALRIVRKAHQQEDLGRLIDTVIHLTTLPNGLEYLNLILYYLDKANKKLTREIIEDTMIAHSQTGKETIMTIADYYTGIGIEQGIEQGIERGKQLFMPTVRRFAEFLMPTKTDDEISELTGLSLEEVAEIRQDCEPLDN